ncbi:hypothetical protein AAFM46_09475 [Arthrobacter sp. TMP15]|uniref:hypothetical protein n=1 Tax=Arthrobacter sp. TMP15 TaxID=3140789 RepID=UPI0031BA2C8D
MSKSTRGSYPHPVLDASDDVNASFEMFHVSIAPSIDDVEVKFQLRMDEPLIQALLQDGTARYSFRWSCSSTIATGELGAEVKLHHADSISYVGWIDQESIRGTVRIDVKIIAVRGLEQYRLQSQHSDYGEATFRVLPGDVLADAGYFDFEPDKLYDPLSPPVGSCFRFAVDSKLKRGLSVRFDDDDHVLVAFPEKVLPGFGMLRNRQDLQISLVVLPALMETISFIKENEAAGDDGEDLTDRKWYTAVRRLIEEVGSFDQRSFELAQKILGNPLDNSLTTPFDGMGDE